MATWNDYLKQAQLYGGAPGILNYGIDTLANKFNNYAGSNQRLDYDQGLSDWGSTMGNVPDAPSMPPMLDQTGQMGASNYRAPQGIPFNPDQGNTGRWDQQNVPDETGIMENLKNKLSGFTTPTMNFFKKMVEPNTPEENFGRKYFEDSMGSSGRVYNNAGDLFGGKNVVSAFGKGMGAAGQKRIDTIENTLRTKYNLGEDEIEDVYAGTYTGPVKSQLIQRLQNFKNQRDQYNRNLQASIGGQDTTGGAVTTGRAVTNVINPNVGGATTSGSGPDMSIRGFNAREAQRAAPGGYSGRGGSGSGPQGGAGYGPWRAEGGRMAQGGRIGYQEGELVEDEYMAEATPGGMMEENIEEVQGEPTREQLEAIALEIFRLPLEELNEEQLNVVYQAAMEQEPAEEEIQFAAQEGPGEGIASLV